MSSTFAVNDRQQLLCGPRRLSLGVNNRFFINLGTSILSSHITSHSPFRGPSCAEHQSRRALGRSDRLGAGTGLRCTAFGTATSDSSSDSDFTPGQGSSSSRCAGSTESCCSCYSRYSALGGTLVMGNNMMRCKARERPLLDSGVISCIGVLREDRPCTTYTSSIRRSANFCLLFNFHLANQHSISNLQSNPPHFTIIVGL